MKYTDSSLCGPRTIGLIKSDLISAYEFEAVAKTKEIVMALKKLTFFNSTLRCACG
jgi:hypothetical protein